MKAKLKTLYLKNYCGYRELFFDFTKDNSWIRHAVFFGPNGTGKSTLLDAVRLVSSPYENLARNTDLAFRKLTFHPDYEVDYQGFKPLDHHMTIEAVFATEDGDKRVVIETDGVKLCELPKKLHGHSYYIDADHPMNMRKFQIHEKYLKDFLEMAEIVYGMKCEVKRRVKLEGSGKVDAKGVKIPGTEESVYTDFIIHKQYAHEPVTKVHFKTMSDGERKIATLLSYLYDPCYIDDRDIILVDNIEMHIYFKRHAPMYDKFLTSFPGKQLICTTHSQTLINHVRDSYGKEHLYDLEEIRDSFAQDRTEEEVKEIAVEERRMYKPALNQKRYTAEEIGFQ